MNPPANLTPQHHHLMPKRNVFGLKPAPRLEWQDQNGNQVEQHQHCTLTDENGELRGSALIRMIDEGLLLHVPPAILAYDLAKWGTAELSSAAREERRAALWPRAKMLSPKS